MFFEDDENELDNNYQEELNRFEAYLSGNNLGFMDSDAFEYILDHYLVQGLYSKANICADVAMEQFPHNTFFKLRKAQSISATGQLKEALNILTQLEKITEPSCEHYLTKAAIFSQLRDSKTAIKYFQEAVELSEPEDREEILIDLAMEYEQLKDFKSALKTLDDVLGLNPTNEVAFYEKAFCMEQLGDLEAAIQSYSAFIDENPYSFTAWYNLGNVFAKMNNNEKAIWAFDYCVLINSEFAPAHFNLGNAYLSQEIYLTAIHHFEKCLVIDGEDALVLCYIGESYEQLEEYDLAKLYYHRCLEFAPDFGDAWLGLGIVLDLEGATKEGIESILKAIELDPNNAGYFHVIAGAYEKIGLNEEARKAYLTAYNYCPENEDVVYDYIDFLMNQKELVTAKKFLEEIEENNSEVAFFSKLLLVNLHYLYFDKEFALFLLNKCIAEDEEKSKELFSLYSDLQNESKIVNLFSN